MTTYKSPLVSVVMPVFNTESYLHAAIDSILGQTFTNFEFILVDDASTDSSLEIIKSYIDSRIKILTNSSTLRVTKTINRGVREANGIYIVRMDSDDWAFPERIQRQVEFMESNRDVVECGSAIYVCDKDLNTINLRRYPITDINIRKKIFRYNPFAHPATIWRRSVVEAVGLYDEFIPLAQDYDLTFRVGRLGKFANLPEPLLKLRTHEKSQSIAKSLEQQKITLLIREKAVKEYGYSMSFADRCYGIIQKVAMRVLPSKLKFKVFNTLRKFL